MPFTQAPVNYAAQYGRELANAYPYLSYYPALWNQGEAQRFRPLRGKTVYIPMMQTSGARAANRDQITGTFNRNWNLEWQACDLSMDREWDTLIDPLDRAETGEVATIANVTQTFNQFQKIPEQDAYMSAKLAGFAAQYGGVSTTSLDASNILAQWDAALEYMTNQRVNRDRVRCAMTPATYKLLKEATGLTRFVETAGGFRGVDRNIARLDGVEITEVPSDMMKTAYTFTAGWAVADGAQQINFLLYDPMAIAAPIVYDVAMVSAGSAATKGKDVYYERYYYDVFCLMQRGAGVYAHIAAAPSLGTLTVTSTAGTASGSTVIDVKGDLIGQGGTIATGMKLVYCAGENAAVSLSYGAVPNSSKTWTEVTAVPFTLTSQTASKYITVALVNGQTGYSVAGGNAVEVVGA